MVKQKFLLFSVLSSVFLTGCMGLNDQNPEGHFKDGQLPKTLDKIINPKVSSDVVRAFKNKDKTGRIKVAVIDSGFDYLHPEVINQIHLDLDEEGNLVGVGKDFFARDNYAHANHANPALYSFTAKEIQQGFIVQDAELENEEKDPLTLMDNLNLIFMGKLVQAVMNHEVLKDTPFVKLVDSQITIFSAASMYWNETNPFNNNNFLSHYEYIKQHRPEVLINWSTETLEVEAGHPLGLTDKDLRWILDLPWVKQSTLPAIQSIEHFDLFREILISEFDAFDAAHGIKERIKNYHLFTNSKVTNQYEEEVTYTQLISAANALDGVYTNHKFGYVYEDLVHGKRMEMCLNLKDSEFEVLNDRRANPADKNRIVKNYFTKIRDNFTFAVKRNFELNPDDLGKKLTYENHEKHLALIDDALSMYPEEYFYCHNLNQSRYPMESMSKELKNPYLDPNGNDNSHGTHVAGTILKQSSKIDIVPIKVVTQSITGNESQKVEAMENYRSWLNEYLSADPVHLELAAEKIIPYFDIPIGSENKSTKDLVIDAIIQHTDATSNLFRFEFVKQIIEAVKYIGEEKIKIANISLGMDNQRSPETMNRLDSLLNGIKALMFDTYKWKVKSAMEIHASDSLFIIAAGNSTQWIDGHSNQVLPCVLNNPELDSLASRATRKTPNILCVGSIVNRGGRDWISGFTNIVIDNLPFIFSYGENIYAPIKTTSCRTTDAIFGDRYARPFSAALPGDPENQVEFARPILEQELGIEEGEAIDIMDPDTRRKVMKIVGEISSAANYMPNIAVGLAKKKLCFENKISMGFMSGTSMAAPNTAGHISAKIAEKMLERSLENDEMYVLEEFSPQQIIAEINEASPSYENTERVADIAKIIDIQRFEVPEFPSFEASSSPSFFTEENEAPEALTASI